MRMTVDMSVNSSPAVLEDKSAGWSDLDAIVAAEKQSINADDESQTNGTALVPANANGTLAAAAQEESDDDEEDLRCGLGVLSPRWMQYFASKQAFLVTFCITWVLQGMYYTYFVSVITTIEKLFQIQSKTTGFIMSATEIGQIGSSLLLTYFGGHGHRPKWIAWGMVLFAISSFTCSVPHFIYGEQLYMGPRNITPKSRLCKSESFDLRSSAMLLPALDTSAANMSDELRFLEGGGCHDDVLREQQELGKITKVVLAIFFISLLGVGMGQTAVYTLGIPYIDDNVATRESPLYFAITIGVRIIGPAMGFVLGSFCTRLYVDLSDPQFPPTDPRWVGAWWLGLVIVSSLLMLSSFAMFSFPKRLKSYHGRPVKKRYVRQSKNPSLKDFPTAVKRLLKNDILMFRTASSVLHILPIAGLYTFLPKYLESQFRLPAHTANLISALGGILVMGVGIIVSGVFILRVKPNARFVAAWIAFTAIVYSVGMCILMLVGCPMDDITGLNAVREASNALSNPPQGAGASVVGGPGSGVCSAGCGCFEDRFAPVCGSDGRTYFSACYAGCRNSTAKDGVIQEFTDCLCIDANRTTTPLDSIDPLLPPASPFVTTLLPTASVGYCGTSCSNFVPYILLFSMFAFIHSTSEVGSMLLILRCVDPRDKAMALGLIQFAIGLFGNVPCPIVYGAVVDYACLIWDTACGKQGACWLYDSSLFRTFYHGSTGAILLCAFFVDLVVWYKAGSINFVDDPPVQDTGEPTTDELSPIKSASATSV